MFEWVYFSSAESIFDGKSVYEKRLALGEVLGEKVKGLINLGEIKPDIVAPIPETSRLATISLSKITNLTYREVLIKNRYIQRSFILGSDSQRAKAVQLKLVPVKHEVAGKNILLIDDSIVRGTTSKQIIKSLRAAGAKEVYLASTCPEIRFPCFFGVDFPNQEKLVAVNRDACEIEKEIGVDKVIYISKDELQKALGTKEICMACVDGNYPVDMKAAENFQQKRKDDLHDGNEPTCSL